MSSGDLVVVVLVMFACVALVCNAISRARAAVIAELRRLAAGRLFLPGESSLVDGIIAARAKAGRFRERGVHPARDSSEDGT